MATPHNLRLNIGVCIDDYKERHKPSHAIVNESSYMELEDEGFIIPDADELEKEYLLHDSGKEKITILSLGKIPEKEKTVLEELMRDKGLPIVLCSNGLITEFKNPKAYDLATQHEELEKKI